MSYVKSSWYKWSMVGFTVVALAAFAIPALGQEADNTSAQGGGYVDDWSHHRLVFSNPGAREDAVKKGTLEKWLNITNDPRYQLQLQKRSMGTLRVSTDPNLTTLPGGFGNPPESPIVPSGRHRVVNDPIEKDWSQSLGGSTTTLTSALAATNTSSTVGPTSTITVGTQTFTTAAPGTASLTATIATPLTNGGNISGSSSLVIDGVTFNASPPVAEIGTFTMGGAVPGTGTALTAAGVTYNFTTATISTTQSANTCGISVASGSRSTTISDLVGAMTNGASGNAKSTTTWECGTISGATATETSFSTTSHTITMTASTVGSTGFSYTLGSSGFTFATNTASSDGTTSVTSTNPETFAYWSGNAPVSSSTLATTIATLVGTTNTTTSAVLTATPNSNNITFTAKVAGTGGNAYSVAPGSFGAFTGGSLTGGTNGPGDTSTTFNYWNGSGYDTGTALATDLHNALALNTVVTTNDGITGTAGTNQIAFATTKAGPFPISVQNFSGFTGVGSIGNPATTATVQPNAYPAKYGASLTIADCANDFVVFPTGEAGSATAPTIVAYNNLYSSCTGSVPSVAWAFNTENGMTGYSATTSPVLSLDGSKVAFIQSNGTNAYLVVVKWASGGTLASPVAPTLVTNITTCVSLPCMTVTELSHNDTYSSPFYDYGQTGATTYQDELFVGDNSGKLEEFTGVFYGAVAISGGSWPANLGTNALSSPVLDTVSGYIFVGDMGGTLYSVGSGTAGTTAASVHGNTGVIADAIADAPLVDSAAQTVFAFVNKSATSSFNGDNTVYQFSTGFTAYGSPGIVYVGAGLTGHYLYAGDFDNVYYQTGTGNIYVVGNTAGVASLYKVGVAPFLTGVSTAVVTGLTAGTYSWPSPLTEFCNGACTVSGGVTNAGSDYVFFSVNQGNHTTYSNCTAGAGNGCIFSFNVSNPAAITLGGVQNYANDSGTNGCWATGGIVIDNDASLASGASQIYFTSLNGAEAGEPGTPTSSACGTGSPATINAIQAAQSAP